MTVQIKLFLKKIILKSRILKFIGADEDSYRQRYLYAKFNAKFKDVIEQHKNECKEKNTEQKYTYIWVYWHQGIDKAPKIVKSCINSIRKNLAETNKQKYKLVLLSNDNIKNYIQLPEYINNKFNKTISITHYSDILRTYLLVRYGGYWIDSSVFISHKSALFNVIEKQELFVFKRIDLSLKYYNKHYISNWFIFSKPNNQILSLTLRLLYEYWKTNNKLDDYFIYHTLFSIVVDSYRDSFNRIPTYNNCTPHVLQFEIDSAFDVGRFNEIKNMSPIHKLDRMKAPTNRTIFSFYDYIIKTYL